MRDSHQIINFYTMLSFVILIVKKFEFISGSPIVKGLQIKPEYSHKYSFMISLQELRVTQNGKDEYIHLCGGALINERWIVTAAHCVYDRNVTNLFVQVGITIFKSKDQPKYSVDMSELYRFNEYTMRNDIALIRISSEYDNVINYLKLPSEKKSITLTANETFCKILGFGAKIYGGHYQNNLYEAEVKLITNEECISILGRIMGPQTGDNTICAVGLNGEDVCQGDSGGPLVCSYNGIDFLYGIISHGINCGGYGIPSVYTIVEKYSKWINEVISRS